VRVLALVRGDHHRRVLERPLHPLLYGALLRRAPVVAPAAVCVCTHTPLLDHVSSYHSGAVQVEMNKCILLHKYVHESNTNV
jgi:hypothetical protein